MRADAQTLRMETRAVLKDALLSYPGAPVHVAIYAVTRCREWNELQADLSRMDAPSDPERVARITAAVDDHLEQQLRQYLDIQ